jgi:hypothetical protein
MTQRFIDWNKKARLLLSPEHPKAQLVAGELLL